MDRKTEIINAAYELFKSYGFTKTTMTDIARRLEISKASLYYYFKDKESIFHALSLREQTQFVEEIEKIIGDTTDSKLKMYSIKRLELLQRLLTLSDMNRGNYSFFKTLFRTLYKEFKIKELNLVKEILQKGIQSQEFKEINIEEYSELFLDVLRGLRRGAFLNSENREIAVLNATEYDSLKKQLLLFTDIFLNSILK